MLRLNAFQLKWIAIVGMVLNHVVYAWWEVVPFWLAFPLYAVGGLTFPIMAYFVVEGYRHTSNLKKYIIRLLIFGLIAVPFHALTFRMFSLNIMFTIIVSILCLVMYDKIKIRPLFWILFILVCILTAIPFFFDWAIIGVIVVLLTHIIKNEKIRRVVPSVVAGIFMLLFSLAGYLAVTNDIDIGVSGPMAEPDFLLVGMVFIIGCLTAALLLKGFNGERGKRMKWMFYTFYPVHLAVLGVVAWAAGWVTLDVLRIWL